MFRAPFALLTISLLATSFSASSAYAASSDGDFLLAFSMISSTQSIPMAELPELDLVPADGPAGQSGRLCGLSIKKHGPIAIVSWGQESMVISQTNLNSLKTIPEFIAQFKEIDRSLRIIRSSETGGLILLGVNGSIFLNLIDGGKRVVISEPSGVGLMDGKLLPGNVKAVCANRAQGSAEQAAVSGEIRKDLSANTVSAEHAHEVTGTEAGDAH